MRGCVRSAEPRELPGVMNVLDGSLLAIDATSVRERIPDGEVLVYAEEGRIIGVLVLDGCHIDALAVRRARRLQGIGAELVEAAADRCDDSLTADFRGELHPFWATLGFDVEPAAESERYIGTLVTEADAR